MSKFDLDKFLKTYKPKKKLEDHLKPYLECENTSCKCFYEDNDKQIVLNLYKKMKKKRELKE
ncbi:MAG: hypothetical protein Satyrvirus24_10 [Satyrvirus sp.]|uniref:Uncharacterized protein n=1 Tax=Satyrvirus sp. TaxID=2487771 RepID=A0A3G5AED8_9VIRU|nr:MAG: hypothetical protein Satyrvirus24_10 [Satyrvirus sp.]